MTSAKIVPLFGVAKNKGDRLWRVRFCGTGETEADFKMTIPFGMTINTHLGKGYEDCTMVIFYFLSVSFGFAYTRAKTT